MWGVPQWTSCPDGFNFCQPITDVYFGQLTNERAQFLLHSIYELSCPLVHGSPLGKLKPPLDFKDTNQANKTMSWPKLCICMSQPIVASESEEAKICFQTLKDFIYSFILLVAMIL